MGGDKGGMKSGGFFHLFDWNRKSRKKLFSGASPEGTKQGKRSYENLPSAQLHLIDEDEVAVVSNGKGSSDYSCASSVTDEEGNGVRVPGVVARLMGLDTLPTSGGSEPYSTPFFDTRSTGENCSHKRSSEFYMNDNFKNVIHRGEIYSRKTMDLRPQKMPSSPIERFQMEVLPPRSTKSISMSHHKLLSPIKNPGFISPKNAAHVMEAAAKILEPGFQTGTRCKVSSLGPHSVPLKVCDSKEIITSQSTSRIVESTRAPTNTTDFSYRSSQPLLRGRNGSQKTPIFRLTPESEGSDLTSVKAKGKSVSLAVQAKVNVQKREGLSTGSRHMLDQKDYDECKLNQPFQSQPSNKKNKPEKKPVKANVAGALRQNNHKQNCTSSKENAASKLLVSNQPGRKNLSGEASCGKKKAVSKLSGNSKVGYRKEGLGTTQLDREWSASSNKDFPQKKRLIERSFYSDKNGSSDNILAGRYKKHTQPNVVIDEHLRWAEENKRGAMDVVSFTFTSPLIKPPHQSRFSNLVEEKSDRNNIYTSDTSSEKDAPYSRNKKLSSLGSNVIGGDALSLLLEQKLRELTAGVELSHCNFGKSGNFKASSHILQESTSASSTSAAGVEHENGLPVRPSKDMPGVRFGYGLSSTNGQLFGFGHSMRVVDEVECSSNSDARKGPDHYQPSPLSILEASFSNESCNSSASSVSTNESHLCPSSIQAQNISSLNCNSKVWPVDSVVDLLDSASSSIAKIKDGVYASEVREGGNMRARNQELEYVRELSHYTGIMSEGIGIETCYIPNAAEALDPLLFDKLERKRWNVHGGNDKESWTRRKMIFDSVNECLDLRCTRYFQAGFRAWARGTAVTGKELAGEIYQEISGWKSMGDWMLDELMEKDMSHHLGRWVDFDKEAFETGIQIAREIFSSLVNEVVVDFTTKIPCQ